MAKNALLQILPSAEKVEVFTRAWIKHQRVDGEIPAAGRLSRGDVRIEMDLKTLMTGGHLRILAGQAEIPLFAALSGELDYAK